MNNKTKILGILSLFIITASSITQVSAASDFVGVSDTLPWLSYYYYTIDYLDDDEESKASVSMSIRNITKQTDQAVIYVLFENDYRTSDPVILREFTIEYEIPEAYDTSSPTFPFGLALLTGSILNFNIGWIINKATPQKNLTYVVDDFNINIEWDSNGVLKGLLFDVTSGSSHTRVEIKRIIEPLYIYGGAALFVGLFVIVICCCAKKKK